MNKRLLVLTGILSVLSVNVMGAPVNVGTDTMSFQMVVMNVSLLNRARYLCRITILVWILMTMD